MIAAVKEHLLGIIIQFLLYSEPCLHCLIKKSQEKLKQGLIIITNGVLRARAGYDYEAWSVDESSRVVLITSARICI